MIHSRYFAWLIRQVCESSSASRYSKLLYKLFDTDFTWKIPLDVNRAKDGINLRRTFSDETEDYEELEYYKDKPCCLLEVMVALALRIEVDIMSDRDRGNRAPEWFWEMIESLDLIEMDNVDYNDDYVEFIIYRFLNREYDRNGRGGLFTVHQDVDMRRAEIWYQMQYYLNEI